MAPCITSRIRRAIAAMVILCSLLSLLACAFGASSTARAGPSGSSASVSVNSGTVPAGGQVIASGSGFASGESVTLSLTGNPAQQGGLQLGAVNAQANGTFAFLVSIPANQSPGSYVIAASGSTSGNSGSVPLQVTPGPQTPTVITVNPSSVVSGAQLAIAGSGFGPGETITLLLTTNSLQIGGVQLGTVTADSSGNFTFPSATIPAGTIANTYLVVARGTHTGASATLPVQVTGPLTAASVNVNPSTVAAGGQLTISGNGFAPGEAISLLLTANPQTTGGLALGTVIADGAGTFTLANLTIANSQPTGSDLVVAIGLYSNRKATAPLQVTAPSTAVAVSVSPGTVAAGSAVTISGTGFAGGEAVLLQLEINTQQGGGLQQATVTADASGSFNVSGVLVPSSQPAGTYVVVATGITSLREASTPLQVTASTVGATVAVNPSTVAAGNPVAISGGSFLPGELVYLTLTTSGSGNSGLPLGSVTADGAGNFSATTTIPVTTPSGSDVILAIGAASGRAATTTLQVTAPQASITANPATFAPSSSISVSGSGFVANEQVAFSLSANNGTGSLFVGQVQADGSGNVAATSVQIPFGVAPGAWLLIATGQTSNRQATAAVTVNGQLPTLTVNPASVVPGAAIAVNGAHFQPGESVVISLVGLNTTTALATVQADGSGAFTIGSVTIALNTAQGAATLVATGATSRLSAIAQITIGANAVTLTLSNGSVAAGGSVGATGAGFAPGETVTVQLHRSTFTPLNLGTFVVDANGGFTSSTLPIARYLNGVYIVSAYGQSSGRVASVNLTIQGAARAIPILSFVGTGTNQASPGGLALVAGANFPANAAITLVLAGFNVTTSLGTVSSNASGTFGPSGLPIPSSVPGATYSLQARVGGRVVAATSLQVVKLSPTFSLNAQGLTPGQVITVNGKGYAPGEQVVLALNGAALATIPSTVIAGSTGLIRATFVVPATVNNGVNTITATGASSHAGDALSETGKLPGATTSYYFPNGDTTSGNRTVISVLNTTDAAASLKLTFLYAGAPERTVQQTLPARRQVLIDLNLVAGTNRHLATIVQSNKQIVAGSTIYYHGGDSASPLGASAPATTWYLAEGYTGGSFHEFLQIMNPGTSYATVDVRFLPFNGRPLQEHRLSLAPRSTVSLDTSTYMPKASFSTIVTSDKGVVVGRSMRFGTNGRGATAEKGVAAASTVWMFAGGVSAANRQTFLSILNPSAASPATVTAAFYDGTGKPVGNATILVNPLSRGNIKLNTVLANSSVAMVVTSNVPVVVERPLYIGPSNLDAVTAGVDVFGRNGGGASWLFPTGDVTGGNQVQFMVYNPSSKTNEIMATFYTNTGTVIVKHFTVPANSGTQLDVNAISGLATGTFGTMLTSTNAQPFVAERRTTNTALGILDGTQGLAQ